MNQLGLFGEAEPVPRQPAARPAPRLSALEELRSWVAERAEDGVECPCCGQLVRVYRRKLNANMARFLCSLVRESSARKPGDWISYRQCEYAGRDYPYVALWGLAETRASVEPRQRTSGLWRPTALGVDFVRGRYRVPSHAKIRDNRVVEWSGELIGVREALGEAFSYEELMRKK